MWISTTHGWIIIVRISYAAVLRGRVMLGWAVCVPDAQWEGWHGRVPWHLILLCSIHKYLLHRSPKILSWHTLWVLLGLFLGHASSLFHRAIRGRRDVEADCWSVKCYAFWCRNRRSRISSSASQAAFSASQGYCCRCLWWKSFCMAQNAFLWRPRKLGRGGVGETGQWLSSIMLNCQEREQGWLCVAFLMGKVLGSSSCSCPPCYCCYSAGISTTCSSKLFAIRQCIVRGGFVSWLCSMTALAWLDAA